MPQKLSYAKEKRKMPITITGSLHCVEKLPSNHFEIKTEELPIN